MTKTKDSNRIGKWNTHAGLLVMLAYGLLCCYFFLERTTFLDNPFSIYKLIQEKALHVSANRWPAASIKIIPLLFIKTQLSLKAILFSFSLSYYLFHLVFFLLTRYQLTDKLFSWLLVATLLLPVAHSFYWNNSELILGLSVMSYWLALIKAEKYWGSLAMSMVLPWFHPLLILLVAFSTVLLLLEKKWSPKLLITNGALYLVMHLIKDTLFPNYYDSNKTILFKQKLSNYSLSDGTLLELISDPHHLPLVILILLIFVLALYKKKIIQAGIFAAFCLAYLFVNDLGSDNTFYVFYHETNFLILFYAAGIIFFSFKLWVRMPYFYVLFAITLLSSGLRIINTGKFYSNRISWYQSTALDYDRSIIDYSEPTKNIIIQDWASAFESLIISSLEGKSAAIILTKNSQKLKKELQANRILLTGMGNHFPTDPDYQYFKLDKKSYQNKYKD